MPLTPKEFEQIETMLDVLGSRDSKRLYVDEAKKILSKYVAEPAPEAPRKSAADFMGSNYAGKGCYVCQGEPSPSPCRQCGWDKATQAHVPKTKPGKVPQPGEAGRQEWLQEATATKLVEVVEADGTATWLNVPEDALDPARGKPVVAGKVYDYSGGKLIENAEETGKMQAAAKAGDKSKIILPGE